MKCLQTNFYITYILYYFPTSSKKFMIYIAIFDCIFFIMNSFKVRALLSCGLSVIVLILTSLAKNIYV